MVWPGKAQWVIPSWKRFDSYHIYGIWVNPDVKVFDKPRYLTNKNMLIISLKYTPVTQITLCIILSMYVANIWLNYKGHLEYKYSVCSLLFLTHKWPWNKLKVIKPTTNIDPKQGYKHAKFERFCFNSFW